MPMASSSCPSSSSFIVSQVKHDVFLSFRGEDTRHTFTSHLFAALCRKNIDTFLDDKVIERGDTLSPTLLAAIEGSKISIIIFSENYASSTWCLDELHEIIKCRNMKGHIVIPVFYRIDPSHVRKQSGSYKDAFIKHEMDNQSKVQKWRMALCEAANLVGWDSSKIRFESEFIEHIVEDVLQKSNHIIDPQVPSELVGIQKHIAPVESLLCIGSTSVRIIGIWGMGGIGKTTLADVLFKKLSSQFEGGYFVGNVREGWTNHRKDELRDKLFTHILGDQNVHISTPSMSSTFVKNRLSRRKVLIVLDDVSDSQQIEYLIGGKHWLGPGSKIIVTTRNKDVLRIENDGIYDVMPLNTEEASKLFSLKAFKQDHPKCGFEHLSEWAVSCAKGVPLALKVLGSLLHAKNPIAWESTLQKLKKVPNAEINRVLRLSFEELDFEEKNIFLDIACFLKGETKCHITNLLHGCGYSADIGLRSLEDKSLITMNYIVEMHDLIQEMGWQVVCQESMKELEKRSRLWDPEEIYHVLKRKMGTNHSTESILLDMSKIKDVEISPETFTVMHNLRLLKFYLPNYNMRCNARVSKGLNDLPDELRYFRWDCFPLKTLPPSFCAEKLVELDLKESLIEKLWDGEQDLSNLKSLFLSGCKHLIELPNLSKAKNLEEIHLDCCVHLREVPPSILSLDHLLAVNLSGCIVLQCIRNEHSRSLRWLNLSGCSALLEFNVTSEKLKYLSLDGTALGEFPTSVGGTKNLSFLSLSGCKTLMNFPSNFYQIGLDTCVKISNCPKLEKLPPIFESSSSITSLRLDGCSYLLELPDNLGLLSALNELSLQGSNIETLPASIKLLSKLRTLNLSHCKRLRSLPLLLLSLQELEASGCISLETISGSGFCRYWTSFARQSEKVGISLRHRCYSQRFDFYSCRRLDTDARKTILDEMVNRMMYAAHMSSRRRVSAESDPYHQFHQVTKGIDPQRFEYACRQLCTSVEQHKFPSWCWVRRVESSAATVKLNGNCCGYCKGHPFAFGIYLSDKEENIDLGFDGRQRICMRQGNQLPIWSYWKLGCNDVRLSLPGSSIPCWFRIRSVETTLISVNLSTHSHCLGFAFCVAVTDCTSTVKWCLSNVRCECYLENEGEGSRSYRSVYSCNSDMDLISDTVFLWYDAYTSNRILETIEASRAKHQYTTYNPKLWFQFSITQEGANYQIKECGVWPIYASESKNRISRVELRLAPKMRRFKRSCIH